MTRPEAGTVVLGGLGVGILTPSFNAVISIRVSDKEPILLPSVKKEVMKDERLTTCENCHGVETCQEQGKLFSLVWHLVLFLLHIERNVCGHACFSVQ